MSYKKFNKDFRTHYIHPALLTPPLIPAVKMTIACISHGIIAIALFYTTGADFKMQSLLCKMALADSLQVSLGKCNEPMYCFIVFTISFIYRSKV